MSNDRYLDRIDEILKNVVQNASKNVADKNKIAYSEELEASGKIKKIAFDVYRVDNDPYDGLWVVENLQGQPYLVRASDPQFEHTTNGKWTVTSSYDKNNVTLSYNKFPVAGFSSEKYGFSTEDISAFKSALLDSVNNDESFVKDVLLEQPEAKRLALINAFPEFKKIL